MAIKFIGLVYNAQIYQSFENKLDNFIIDILSAVYTDH
jgi:hypothetical protein